QQQVMADIRKSLVRASEGADIRLTLSGAPFFALNSRQQIRSESQQLSIMASLFMILFMAWVYRDARRVLMTALPLIAGVMAGAATVSLFFGYIHGITLAFGITLIGVAIDYPVHVLSHAERSQRLEQAVRVIWPTLRLGVLTTVLGFAAMALTRFTGLAQLGVFAIGGLLVAALATRSLLPAIQAGDLHQPEPRLMQLAEGLDDFRPFIVLQWLSLLVVIILLVLAVQKSQLWSEDIAELSPIPQQLRTQDAELRGRLGSVEPRYLLMIEGGADEEILQKQEQLSPFLNVAIEQGEIDGAQWAAQLIPSMRTQLLRQALLPEQEPLSQSLNAALLELPFRHETFEPFLADVESARQLPPLQPDAFNDTSLGLKLDSLFLGDGQRVGLVHLSGVSKPQAFMNRVQNSGLTGLEFVDLKSETNRMVNGFRDEAVNRIVWASLLILVVLALGLRSLRRLIQVVLPIVLAVAVSASVPLLLGERLNLFHLVSMLLVAGIGLDYGLFFSRRDRSEIRGRTLHALLICAVSTLVVFAMLATSSIPVLHAIGITVSSGVAATFLLAWLFSRPGRSMGEL
ncbi:MAG: MMPL family transporter, partial [Gammaproteobacteria bacterium]|nr:MMPL family transporter [Gammaproteobacteria bacterium]